MSTSPIVPTAPWSKGRKIATTIFVLLAVALLAAAAPYLSGVLFLVINKADPRQAHWLSIAQYWDFYKDDPLLRKKLVISMVGSGVGLFVLLPAVLLSAAPAIPPAAWRRALRQCDRDRPGRPADDSEERHPFLASWWADTEAGSSPCPVSSR